MTALNAFFKSLNFDAPGISTTAFIGFVVAAAGTCIFVILLWYRRSKHGPFDQDKRRFAIAVLVGVVASNIAENILYSVFRVRSVYAAIPIEFVSYAALMAVALFVLHFDWPEARHK